MEWLDLYDINGNQLGRQAQRGAALSENEYIKIVHICIFNRKNQMLIQKRSDSVDSYPGLWDLSAGGHVLSGESAFDALVRETGEELGLMIPPIDRSGSARDSIRYLFTEQFLYVLDDIYLWHLEIDPGEIAFQKSEIASLKWASVKEVLEAIRNGSFVDYTEECIQRIFLMASGKQDFHR